MGIALLNAFNKDVGERMAYLREYYPNEPKYQSEDILYVLLRPLLRRLADLVLDKIKCQLDGIAEKTKKERLILNRLAPNHFDFSYDGDQYKEIQNMDHRIWTDNDLFYTANRLEKRLLSGRYADRIESMVGQFVEVGIEDLQRLGI